MNKEIDTVYLKAIKIGQVIATYLQRKKKSKKKHKYQCFRKRQQVEKAYNPVARTKC